MSNFTYPMSKNPPIKVITITLSILKIVLKFPKYNFGANSSKKFMREQKSVKI